MDGVELDLENEAPLTVKHFAEEDSMQHTWIRAAGRHAHLAHLDRAPYLDAARELLDGDCLSAKQAGLLRAFLGGAFFRSTACTCGEEFTDPLAWWAHYAWACPATAPARAYMKLPQHHGKMSLDGLPEDFEEKIQAYTHLPWVRTALLPDPRDRLPPPAKPGVVKWSLPGGGGGVLRRLLWGRQLSTHLQRQASA